MVAIARNVASSDMSKLFLASTYIMSTPRISTEAIVTFPGMGEDERVIRAANRWENENFVYLLVTGLSLHERTARKFTLETLREPPFNLIDASSQLVFTQVDAANTVIQAEWTAEMVKELDIDSLTLTVSPYHLPRAYLTLLNSLLKRGLKVALIPDPTPTSLGEPVPELGIPASEMGAGEMERILAYQEKGDVASFESYFHYNEWLLKYIRDI